MKFVIVVALWFLLSTGYGMEDSSYNYSASIECLVEPLVPQYEGGLVANPEFNSGLEGWRVFGSGKIEVRKSPTGNRFLVAYDRHQPNASFTQAVYLEKELVYTFSAWLQINKGTETVVAALKSSRKRETVIGSVIAQSGCWSMLKGGITVDLSMPTELYFESTSASIELWADSISLQPFTKIQWRDQQSKTIEKTRKRTLRLHVSDNQGHKLQGVEINIQHIRPHFPLGCATAHTIVSNQAYQKWFTSRGFTATTFDNEMKWYYTEVVEGHENYSVPDAMLAFVKQHGISVRGHNIFWDAPKHNLNWVKDLSRRGLVSAAMRRMGSVMGRYMGEVIAWDVMNENLHFSFFEQRLGPNASAMFYKIAQALDPQTTMFLNEFKTLEYPESKVATPSKYLQKIKEIRSFPGNEEMVVGIGLQGHFGVPNIPFMRASLDVLGATKMPIWLTELDVERGPNQALRLEEVMREAYSHPSVQGIIVWSGWTPMGCRKACFKNTKFKEFPYGDPAGCASMCLTDNNFNTLPTGEIVEKLMEEWKTKILKGATDAHGVYEHSVFHGVYLLTVLNPYSGKNFTRQLKVTNDQPGAFDVWISI